jgi:phage terminase large subunit-like protein
LLTHSKGQWAKKPFILIPYQEEFLSQVFGWVDKDGLRMIRTAYLEIPKKNGKSPLAAGVALFLLCADNEPGAEIYGAAGDREQASIVYNYARDMVNNSDYLSERLKIIESRKRIIDMSTGSVFVAVSSDVPTKHGPNLHGVVFDELHAQRNRDLWDTLTTGTAARRQPLITAITTAGIYSENHICWEQHSYGLKVAGDPMSDPTHFSMIFNAERNDDWRDKKTWYKANPALNIFRSLEHIQNEAKKAEQSPAYQNTFCRLFLNQWTAQTERWIDMMRWSKTAGEVFEEDLSGEMCYGGLDLSSRIDLTAFVMVFPEEGGYFDIVAKFWMPEEEIQHRTRRDNVPYESWVQSGLIKAIPGAVVDLDEVIEDIAYYNNIYNIASIAYDRWGALHISKRIQSEVGVQMIQFGQGYASMSEPSKSLVATIVEQKLRHGNNPVLNWNAESVSVAQDAAGNIKPVKPNKRSSTLRIDGIVSLIMAFSLALNDEKNSVYDYRGLTVV